MPFYDLLIQATLESIASISVDDGFNFRVKFQCESCRDTSEKSLVFGWHDEVEVPGGKGIARVLAKCKGCNRQYNVDIISKKSDFNYTLAQSGEWGHVATLECRGGAAPVSFEAGDGFFISGSKTAWHNQDLSEDWADYDEKADESVSILAFTSKFQVSAKKK